MATLLLPPVTQAGDLALPLPPGSYWKPPTHSSLQSCLTRAGSPRNPSPPYPPWAGTGLHLFKSLDLTSLSGDSLDSLDAPPIHSFPRGHGGFSRVQICSWALHSLCHPLQCPRSRRRNRRRAPWAGALSSPQSSTLGQVIRPSKAHTAHSRRPPRDLV